MGLRRYSNRTVHGWVDSGVTLPRNLIEDWNTAPAIPGSELVLDCRGRQIYRADLERSGTPHPCFIYLFRNQSFSRSLRKTHAFHILQIAERIKASGFNTLEVLAALKPKNETLNWHSLLIASEIESVSELPSAGNHVSQVHEFIEFDTKVASSLAGELSKFHERKLIHGDLKTRHILTSNENSSNHSSNGARKFHLVDLEKSRHFPLIPSTLLDVLAARDLVQLFASLPTNSNGHNLVPTKDQFLSEYFSKRNISGFRAALIRRILGLYSPEGGLRQGETILTSLIGKITGR